MISIVKFMGKIKKSESFDKLERVKRWRTLDAKSSHSHSLTKRHNDSYNKNYGKKRAAEYIKVIVRVNPLKILMCLNYDFTHLLPISNLTYFRRNFNDS